MTREHIRAFKGLPGVELSGVFSRTKIKADALATEFSVLHVCDSIRDLYNKTNADLVIVSVPVLTTKEVVLEALQYPWIQLIEKPVGKNIAEAEEILAASKKFSGKGFAAFNRRFYSSTKAVIQDQADSNEKRLVCVYDQEDPWAEWEEPRSKELIDNWMFANSIHLIDYFRFLGRGKIISVEPHVRWNPDDHLAVAARLTYDSGDIGLYQSVWGAPGPWAVTVTTKSKRWELRPLEQASFQLYGTRKLEVIPVDQADVDFKAGLKIQAVEAIKMVNGLPHQLVTLEDSLETMKLVEQIYAV